jgi:hypothetical protein
LHRFSFKNSGSRHFRQVAALSEVAVDRPTAQILWLDAGTWINPQTLATPGKGIWERIKSRGVLSPKSSGTLARWTFDPLDTAGRKYGVVNKAGRALSLDSSKAPAAGGLRPAVKTRDADKHAAAIQSGGMWKYMGASKVCLQNRPHGRAASALTLLPFIAGGTWGFGSQLPRSVCRVGPIVPPRKSPACRVVRLRDPRGVHRPTRIKSRQSSAGPSGLVCAVAISC